MTTPIRRYTPPTCTLEIRGQLSPLSIWTGKNLLKSLGFELKFDDPKMPGDQQITIKGDRTQLQVLSEIVFNYVQNLLASPAAALPLALVTSPDEPSNPVPSLPGLRSRGLLNHELFLGSLIRDSARDSITLTTSQLFDLVSVLEEYSLEADLLPAMTARKARKKTLIYSGIAAGTVLAIGGTTLGVLNYQRELPVATLENPTPTPTVSPLPNLPLPPTGKAAPSPNLPASLGNATPLPTPANVTPAPAPTRPNSVPLVVPPTLSTLPPPPTPSRPSTPIVIRPDSSPLSPPPPPKTAGTNAVADVAPETLNPTPKSPNLPALPPINAGAGTDDNISGRARNETALAPSPSSTLLDTIPQVAEAREYFKSRWQPPQSLKQTLEYRLVLNKDGSLKQIIPLGRAAQVYIDRTGMPLLNEPFVSPLEIAGNPQLRLVLSPDGTVRTFMEQ